MSLREALISIHPDEATNILEDLLEVGVETSNEAEPELLIAQQDENYTFYPALAVVQDRIVDAEPTFRSQGMSREEVASLISGISFLANVVMQCDIDDELKKIDGEKVSKILDSIMAGTKGYVMYDSATPTVSNFIASEQEMSLSHYPVFAAVHDAFSRVVPALIEAGMPGTGRAVLAGIDLHAWILANYADSEVPDTLEDI